jgi:beta-RFAP synthase
MTDRVVRVVASSRLHFGMLSVNQPGQRRYGGVGAMVDAPGLEIILRPAKRLEASGPMSDRALQAAKLAAQSLGSEPVFRIGSEKACLAPDALGCRMEIVRAPPLHVGLGAGTQLAVAVAAGLNAWLERPPLPADRLARCVGRGRRSAIGLHGFVHGGLLYDSGKTDEEGISPLGARVGIPPSWRFALVRPRGLQGLSDEAEREAFAGLPPVPVERTEMLRREALDCLLPAAAAGRFEEFSESLYRFGHAAGLSFAAAQGGAFAGQRLAALVEWIRACGVRGVGQTSWGPTLFAALPDHAAAQAFLARLRARPDARELEVTLAAADNRGARIEATEGGVVDRRQSGCYNAFAAEED